MRALALGSLVVLAFALTATFPDVKQATGACPETGPPPLPSEDGLSFNEAWGLAGGHAGDAYGPDVEIVRAIMFEGTDDVPPGQGVAGRVICVSGESLDGRIQGAGYAQFLLRLPDDQHVLVVVESGGAVREHERLDAPAFPLSALRGDPEVDVPAALLDCRRAGADEFLHETGSNFVTYDAVVDRNRNGTPDWILIAFIQTVATDVIEREAAQCHIPAWGGNVTYVHPETYARPA